MQYIYKEVPVEEKIEFPSQTNYSCKLHSYKNISESSKYELQLTYQNFINPLTTNVPHRIETSQLICIANQLTGFYMMGNIGR